MIHLPSVKFSRIKERLLNILSSAAERLFLTSLVLILIALMINLAVFYKDYILPQRVEPKLETEPIKFKEDVYIKILQEWQSREERFENADAGEYLNPFK